MLHPYKEYTGESAAGQESPERGRRAIREAILFQMINEFDLTRAPDAEQAGFADEAARRNTASGEDAVTPQDVAREYMSTKPRLTLAQKRRIRNETVRIMQQEVIPEHNRLADEQNAGLEERNAEHRRRGEPEERPVSRWTPYSNGAVVESFFRTGFGKQYAGQKDLWRVGARTSECGPSFRAIVNPLADWTVRCNPESDVRRTVISPYDPMFASSDLFDDDFDQLGYVIGSVDPAYSADANARRQLPQPPRDAQGNAAVSRGDGLTMMSQRCCVMQDGVIHIKAVYPGRGHSLEPYDVATVSSMLMDPERAPRELEGDLTRSGYKDIAHYVRTREERDNVRRFLMSQMESQREPSSDERRFMSDVCRYLSDSGMDFEVKVEMDHLVASVKSPKADIRILSVDDEQYQGRIYSQGVVTRLGIAGGTGWQDTGADAASLITPEDRLNMIKWYFGEPVAVAQEGYSHNVGVAGNPINAVTGVSRAGRAIWDYQNPVNVPNSRERDVSITFATRQGEDGATAGTINIQRSVVSVRNWEDSPETVFSMSLALPDDSFGVPGAMNPPVNRDPRIPEGKRLPEDAAGIRYDSDREYYRHLIARERLAEWVQSAKDNYTDLVDLDGMARAIRQADESGEDAVYDFSEDDGVAEAQMRYWLAMSAGGAAGREDRIAEVAAAFEAEREDLFGTVPEITRPAGPVPDGQGFNPEAVAQYVSNAESSDVPQNQGFILHMLHRMGDDYDPDMLKGTGYVANNMKNRLVRFNKDDVMGTINLAMQDVRDGDKVAQGIRDGSLGNLSQNNRNRAQIEEGLEGLAGAPFTREMLAYTADTLVSSGCDPSSVAVRVDSRGVIEYTGYVMTAKSTSIRGMRDRNGQPVRTMGYSEALSAMNDLARRQGKPGKYLSASFDEDRCLDGSLIDPAQAERDPALQRLQTSVGRMRRVHGYIGQIFEPDEYGAIVQDTVVPDTRVLVPGYDARLVENDPDNPTPMRDRLRLIGIEQHMRRAIVSNVRDAVYTLPDERDFEPHGADLNAVYRHAYEQVLDGDYYERMLPPMGKEPTEEQACFLRVIEAMKGRCKFPNEYGEGSTTACQSYLEHPSEEAAKAFDYYYSDLCDNHNLRVLGREFDGIFDKDMTGTAKNQGLVRYLAEGVTVSADGSVTPVPDNPDGTPARNVLMEDPAFATAEYNSWDRRQMAISQTMSALGTPRKVGVAMMNIEGWTFDDGMPVSRAFAEAHPIVGSDGEMRPLMAQDKLSDFSGNKGVIGAVIDPELASWNIAAAMQADEFQSTDAVGVWTFRDTEYHIRYDRRSSLTHEQQAVQGIQKDLGVDGMDPVMRLFEDNPDVEIVMAPYSGMSRTNGGIVRELMQPAPEGKGKDVVLRDGDGKPFTVEGGMGYTNIIIVDMPADVKTHWYDEEAIANGKGRKASGQLAWALCSKGCSAIMQEFYGNNAGSLDDLRECAISLGLDFNENMEPVIGYHPQESRGERRSLMKLPDLDSLEEAARGNGSMDQSYTVRTRVQGQAKPVSEKKEGFAGFLHQASLNQSSESRRSVRLLPGFADATRSRMQDVLNRQGGFMELPFPLEFKTPEYAKLSQSLVAEGLFTLQKTGQTYTTPDGREHATYGMPVLPQGMRCGQEFHDGTSSNHAYTKNYLKIYKSALTYMAAERELLTNPGLDDRAKELLRNAMTGSRQEAQASFDKVTADIAERKFNTKYNVIREGVMSARIPNSATAVWSADPRLPLDTVAMSRENAAKLGVYDPETGKMKGDGRVLLWRDPVLHDDNVRYMRVALDDSVIGVRVNPLSDKCFDGDFDGDSVGLTALKTKAAQDEAYARFSFEANLLQKGVVSKDGSHPLYFQDGLDVAANMWKNPALKERWTNLTRKVNEMEEAAARLAADPSPENEAAVTATVMRRPKGADGRPMRGAAEVPVEVHGKQAVNALRKQYMQELSDLGCEALKGTATSHIRVGSIRDLVESVQEIVDSKAKGNQSKMRDYMDNVGITYELGPDGRADLSTVRDLTDGAGRPVPAATAEGRQRDVDMAIQETAAYKADNTALGGTSSQGCVEGFRNYNLTAALELTYPITQAILQSKHDPKDAKVKDEIVRFWGKDVWDGYKLTGDFSSGDPESIQKSPHRRIEQFVLDEAGQKIPVRERKPVYGRDGKPQFDEDGRQAMEWVDKVDEYGNTVYQTAYAKCTPEEWKQQMMGMMCALKVDVNPAYMDEMAATMTRKEDAPLISAKTGYTVTVYDKDFGGLHAIKAGKGTVMGVTDFAREKGALMDRMAYNGKLGSLVQAAMNRDPNYRSEMGRLGRGHELNYGSYSSIMSDGLAHALEESARKEALEAASAKQAAAKEAGDQTAAEAAARERAEALSGLRDARSKVEPSAMFMPRQFAREAVGDASRRESGSDMNTYTKRTRDADGNEARKEVLVAPKPVGSRACRVRREDYEAGAAVMGERQSDYEARVGLVRQTPAAGPAPQSPFQAAVENGQAQSRDDLEAEAKQMGEKAGGRNPFAGTAPAGWGRRDGMGG